MVNNKKNDYWAKIKDAASEGFSETIYGMRERAQEHLNNEYNRGFFDSMEIAVTAFLEINVGDNDIVHLLMNHWNLRKTEALDCLANVKNFGGYNSTQVIDNGDK